MVRAALVLLAIGCGTPPPTYDVDAAPGADILVQLGALQSLSEVRPSSASQKP